MKRVLKPKGHFMPHSDDITVRGKVLYIGTARKEEEESIRSNSTVNCKMLSAIPDMIIRTDNEGKLLTIEIGDEKYNPHTRKPEMIGQYIDDLFPEEVAVVHMKQLEKVLRTKKSAGYAYQLETGNDEPAHYEVRVIYSNDNEVLFIIRDTTKNRNERLSLIRGIIEGEEKERKRVAQELHDGLGQIMSALYMQVGTLSKKPAISEYLTGPMKMIADIISEYRAISHNLMPPALEDSDLPDVLKTLLDRINATGQCTAVFHIIKFKSNPDKYVIRELYRIAQELISNAIRHSGCDLITIDLNESSTHMIISISDNGKGFDVSEVKKKTEGIGLKNISTRVELIGGTVEFSSANDKGTTVILSVPKPGTKNGYSKKQANHIKNQK